MIAIVDGGSSKCDWVIVDNSGALLLKTETIGFNPNMISTELISVEIHKNPHLSSRGNQIQKLFFYGSGCGSEKNALAVRQELMKIFPSAEVEVKEDMTAAAYAAYHGKPAVICILGTGSNSCFFDGTVVRRDLPSLGFLIGDEGSGAALGKQLLRRFFMKKLPADLHEAFTAAYALTAEDAIRNMYHSPRPNAYLAGFNSFVAERKKHPYLEHMVLEEMKNFLEYQVIPYPEASTSEINFIGSIAYEYEEILRAAAAEMNLNIGTVIQKPIEGLVEYHRNHLF